MEERMARTDDLADKPFDPEMTEGDEANAPDDTGRTTAPGEISGETASRDVSDGPEEAGI